MENVEERKKLIEVRDVSTHFQVKSKRPFAPKRTLKAVDHVSFDIFEGETFGLVGESGCGKTTIGKTILYLYPPTTGSIIFDGTDLSKMSKEELRLNRKNMQIVFQDPYSSLNPRMSVGEMLAEPYIVHKICGKKEAHERAEQLLETVGLKAFHARRYPHEFSGGQRQRISIARALTLNPRFIVCDEAVSALDVSVQSQIINLLEELKEDRGLTYLFISHDLNVVRHISDRVGVMYLGRMVETAPEKQLYTNPLHPYTQVLFAAAPVAKITEKKEHTRLKGELPSPLNPPPGCPFNTRCPKCTEECKMLMPELREVEPGHFCACHHIG